MTPRRRAQWEALLGMPAVWIKFSQVDIKILAAGPRFLFEMLFERLFELLFERLFRMRARAKMIVKGGVCTPGCDERELCV